MYALSLSDFHAVDLTDKSWFIRFDVLFVKEGAEYEIYFKKNLRYSYDKEGMPRKVIIDILSYSKLDSTIKRLYISKNDRKDINVYIFKSDRSALQLKSLLFPSVTKLAIPLNGNRLDLRRSNIKLFSPSTLISQITSGRIRPNASVSNTGELNISESNTTVKNITYHRYCIRIKFRKLSYSKYINIEHYPSKELALQAAINWRNNKIIELRAKAKVDDSKSED